MSNVLYNNIIELLNKNILGMKNIIMINSTQQTNAPNRAKQQYKNKGIKHLFYEIILNSIHACNIHGNNKSNISIEINRETDKDILTFRDNGCGISPSQKEKFLILNGINQEKAERNYNPKGEGGRLTVLHFTDSDEYKSTFRDGEAVKELSFNYKSSIENDTLLSLFDSKKPVITSKTQTGLELTLYINKDEKRKLLTTFLNNCKKEIENKNRASEAILNHIKCQFFPFFIENKEGDFHISVIYKDTNQTIPCCSEFDTSDINQEEIVQKELDVIVDNETKDVKDIAKFTIHVLKNDSKKNNILNFCARGLLVKWQTYKIEYKVNEKDTVYITSKYLDDNVNQRGDNIDIENYEVFEKIKNELKKTLDEIYQSEIKENKKHNKELASRLKKENKFIASYIECDDEINYRLKEEEILENAHELRKQAEIKMLYDKGKVTDEEQKKISRTSLLVYMKSRQHVLEKLGKMLQPNSEGKFVLEREIHDVIFERGQGDFGNIWVIDDKYNYFDNAYSSKNFDKGSDIYLQYRLEEQKQYGETSSVLFVELKRPGKNKAHNSREMYAQLKEQAKDFYEKKVNYFGKTIDTSRCIYEGYIIADISDIDTARKHTDGLVKLPGLNQAYYTLTHFHPNIQGVPDEGIKMVVNLISYHDMLNIANKRHKKFFEMI